MTTPEPTKPSTWLVERTRALFAARAGVRPAVREFEPVLAVFGKHPAFGPEHLEAGLGPGVGACASLKSRIYNRCIDPLLPRWQALPETDRLPAFDHLLLFLDSVGGAILGRLIELSDSVGRSGFPAVLLVHLPVHSPEALRGAGIALERFERRLNASLTPKEVVEAAAHSQADLNKLIGPSESTRIDLPSTRRLLGPPPPGHLRVETSSTAPLFDMLRTAREVRQRKKTETLVLVPRGQPWADAIYGEFGPEEFFPVMLLKAPETTALPASPTAAELWPDENDEARDHEGHENR